MDERGSRRRASLSEGATPPGRRGGAPLLRTLEDVKRKTLEKGISVHRGPTGEPGRGHIYLGLMKDEWRRALGVGHFSLRELYEGNLVGGFLYWGP